MVVKVYLRFTDQNGQILNDKNNSPVLDNDNATVSENELSISIKNEPGTALPATGGPGTHLFYLFGILFTVIASTGLVMKKRRAA